MKKKFLALLMGMTLSLGCIIPVSAETTNNTGWVQASNGSWNYNKADGSKSIGWVQDGKDWYYFWSNGEMATGWVQSSGNWYYLTANGAMATDTVVDGYYVNSDGAWTTRPSGDIYTGAKIKDKLYGLGFFDGNYGGYRLNPNGSSDLGQNDYLNFSVLSGGKDMNLSIYCTNSEVEQKVPIILNWILPTQGNYLNSVLEDSNLKSQTLELDGRTVTINSQQRFLSVTFGPIK